jgi:hypothetical protein
LNFFEERNQLETESGEKSAPPAPHKKLFELPHFVVFSSFYFSLNIFRIAIIGA